MEILLVNLNYMWASVLLPRNGDVYVFGGTLNPTNVNSGTDCLAEGTLVTTARGEIPIEQLTVQDLVLTRRGFRRVLRTWKVRDDAPVVELTVAGRTLCGTADHRVWTENRGWASLGSITRTDTLVGCQGQSESCSRASSIVATPTPIGHLPAPISSAKRKRVDLHHCIGRSGNITTGRSPQVTRFTTKTITHSTTAHQTLSASQSLLTDVKVPPRVDFTITPVPNAGSNSERPELLKVHADSAASDANANTMSVYDLSVEGVHEFFANGVLVHNCSGWVSAANEGIKYGPGMTYARQFSTLTFAGAVPGDTGPFGGAAATSDWVCIASPADAPAGSAMIVAVLQLSDPTQAHMVASVLDPNNLTGYGGPGVYVGIESGGQFVDADGNSTCHIGPDSTSITNPMFNQFFALPPLADPPGDDMATVPQAQWDQLYATVCGAVESKSPFHVPGEAVWTPGQMWVNDDGMIHPQYLEWAAQRGDQGSLAALQTIAALDPTVYTNEAADIALAKAVLSRMTQTPTPAPTPSSPGLNITAAQVLGWLKDAVTVLGAVATWVSSEHLHGAPATAVPATLAVLTAGAASHTIAQRKAAVKAAQTPKGTS